MPNKWLKKLNLYKFPERVLCPYCSETYPSNLSLFSHVLREHNWNKDFLKDFEVLETDGPVMIVQRREVGKSESD